uniref:Uncharacterized protein n=1 Tax=Arundo donax TaxID=35708 RepID=A0A0A9BMF8_ARUDO
MLTESRGNKVASTFLRKKQALL